MSEKIVRFVIDHLGDDMSAFAYADMFNWFDIFAWEEENVRTVLQLS